MLLAETATPDDAASLANSLVRVIDSPFHLDPYELMVTLSIGIALYPHDGKTDRELMFNADAAMYHTKHMGRNGYHFFQPSMNTLAQTHLQLMNDLWQAIDRDELRLLYQPKFHPCRAGHRVRSAVTLAASQTGITLPDLFLPLAEKTGLIIPIGNWVIDEACRQLREWHLQGHTDWSMAVNLSTLQFEQPSLVKTVLDCLTRHSVPPGMLIPEVTETTAMSNPDESVRVLTALTDAGVKASIDDFGTGYSSFLYLKRLPACELKIDRAFVKELSGERRCDNCLGDCRPAESEGRGGRGRNRSAADLPDRTGMQYATGLSAGQTNYRASYYGTVPARGDVATPGAVIRLYRKPLAPLG